MSPSVTVDRGPDGKVRLIVGLGENFAIVTMSKDAALAVAGRLMHEAGCDMLVTNPDQRR